MVNTCLIYVTHQFDKVLSFNELTLEMNKVCGQK